MGLSSSCRSIGEAGHVVALLERRNQRAQGALEHLNVGLLVVEDFVEGKLPVSYSRVVVDEIAVVDVHDLGVLRPVSLDDGVGRASIGRHMPLLSVDEGSDADTDAEGRLGTLQLLPTVQIEGLAPRCDASVLSRFGCRLLRCRLGQVERTLP